MTSSLSVIMFFTNADREFVFPFWITIVFKMKWQSRIQNLKWDLCLTIYLQHKGEKNHITITGTYINLQIEA